MHVRRAVRDALTALPAPARQAPLLVGCSGGADSLALTLAAVAVRGADGVQAAIVDHRLQDGSAERAAATAALLTQHGITADVHTVSVTGPGGIEAAARHARQDALRAARPHPDSPILLGHTLDDQAETLLLGLGRGSGARSLAGMRRWDPPWVRPLLDVRRATTRAACAGLPVWDDPHNADPHFTRVRLRHQVIPLLEDVLAGGVAEALARTAAQLREDVDALDVLANDLLPTVTHTDPGPRTSPAMCVSPTGCASAPEIDAAALKGVPAALRRRVLRAWLTAAGVTGLTDNHLRAADVLAARGPDRAGVAVPGGLELFRAHGRLGIRPVRWPSAR
ncbi:MAG: tRNA lysidine(34) synthetase TilS [Pseudonocardia sp.]|nr:tRNA lysidine(34) synthetase TilS [Pseudonocardia sp.]